MQAVVYFNFCSEYPFSLEIPDINIDQFFKIVNKLHEDQRKEEDQGCSLKIPC